MIGSSVEVAGIHLVHPLFNAAGTCKLVEQVDKLALSDAAAIMVGSITVEPRAGNGGRAYWSDGCVSLNFFGLPNPGANYYAQKLPLMVASAHAYGKPLFVSVAGFSPEEYGRLAALAFEKGADLVELNLDCPNVWHEGKQKQIACFHPQLVAEILRCVGKEVGPKACIAVKLSPFSDPVALEKVARVLARSKIVRAVTAVNTFPNALVYDENGKPCITAAGNGFVPSSSTVLTVNRAEGLAGLGGSVLKPIGLGQVKQLRALLPSRIAIIGVGGISGGRDILDYLQAGASFVQVATAYIEFGCGVFARLRAEFCKEISH